MHPLFEEWVRSETRRQFFSRGANAVGAAALASLLGADAPRAGLDRHARRSRLARAGAPLSGQGQAGDLPAHGRRALADRPVRLQAANEGMVRQGPARLDPHGPAADDDDLGPEAVSRRAVEVQVRPARPVRHVDLRAAAEPGQGGRRHLLRPQHAHRGHQPRAGDQLHPNRQPDHRPALPGVLGLVWPGADEPRPADLRGAGGQADQHRAGAGDFGPAVVGRLPARANMPASRSAPAATRSCTSTTRRACPRRCGATRSTACGRSTS